MSRTLPDVQLAILRALWERGEATVPELREALAPERELAPSTVATHLSRMEKKGAVAHRTEGRRYVYRPLLGGEEVRRTAASRLLHRLFAGDVAAAVTGLLDASELRPGDLEAVQAAIEAHRQGQTEDPEAS